MSLRTLFTLTARFTGVDQSGPADEVFFDTIGNLLLLIASAVLGAAVINMFLNMAAFSTLLSL